MEVDGEVPDLASIPMLLGGSFAPPRRRVVETMYERPYFPESIACSEDNLVALLNNQTVSIHVSFCFLSIAELASLTVLALEFSFWLVEFLMPINFLPRS